MIGESDDLIPPGPLDPEADRPEKAEGDDQHPEKGDPERDADPFGDLPEGVFVFVPPRGGNPIVLYDHRRWARALAEPTGELIEVEGRDTWAMEVTVDTAAEPGVLTIRPPDWDARRPEPPEAKIDGRLAICRCGNFLKEDNAGGWIHDPPAATCTEPGPLRCPLCNTRVLPRRSRETLRYCVMAHPCYLQATPDGSLEVQNAPLGGSVVTRKVYRHRIGGHRHRPTLPLIRAEVYDDLGGALGCWEFTRVPAPGDEMMFPPEGGPVYRVRGYRSREADGTAAVVVEIVAGEWCGT